MTECRNVACYREATTYIRVVVVRDLVTELDADWPYCREHYRKHAHKYGRFGNHTFFENMEGFREEGLDNG